MSEHAAFLNAIMERPEDDLPRLVYADFLEETGDATRAEFIRVQIELARLERQDDRFEVLASRERELLEEGVGWDVPDVRGIQTFRRGFVESLDTTAEWLIHATQPPLLLAPIRELRIRNADNAIDELAQVPGLERIESLDLRNNSFGTQDRIARFFTAAPLRSMARLVLSNNQLWSDNVERLLACPWVSQLRSLDLSGNAIGDAGAELLARTEGLRGLQTLILRSEGLDWRDRIEPDGAEALGHSETLPELRVLYLGGHSIGLEGAGELIVSPRLKSLEQLDTSYNRVTFGEDSSVLFAIQTRVALRSWNLTGSTINLLGAESFANWPHLETLDELILEECEWAPGARELLAASPWAYKIRMGNPASGELA